METPELIQDALANTGWSRAELARRAGVTQSVLSAYEHLTRQPSVAALNRILRAAGRELRAGPLTFGGAVIRSGGAPMTTLLVGGRLAASVNDDTRRRSEQLRRRGVAPTLAVLVGTGDEAAARYVRGLERAARRVDIGCEVVEATDAALAPAVAAASARPDVHGVVVQTPLPFGLRTEDVVVDLDPAKDVDGAHPTSAGRLALGLPAFSPATAEAVIELLVHHGVVLDGSRVAVVGRSTVVGRPLVQLLIDRHATVTVCHSRTPDLAETTALADVLVVAAGRPGLIRPEHVGSGAVVIDVGTNVDSDGVLRGDVDPAVAGAGAGGLSPVPGGVGPVTTAVLLRHVIEAAERLIS